MLPTGGQLPYINMHCIDKQWLLIPCRNVIHFLHTTQSHDDCANSQCLCAMETSADTLKNNTTDGWTHFFTELVAGSQFGRRKTENKTRSVTLEPSDNDSASYYAFVPATRLTAASLLASACYGCLAEEPG